MGGPCRPGVVALVEGFEGSRPGAVQLHEVLVVALEGLLAVRGDADQAAEDVDRLELVGDEAAGGDLDRAFPGALQQVEDFLASGREAEEGLGLQQEGAVVADVVDDGELLAVVGLAEAAAELLEPQDPRLRGAEHEDGVELGEVEAFVEDVHRADDVELALRELLQRLRPRGRGVAGVDGHGAQALLPEEVGHEVGVALRDAEGQGARAAALLELLEGVSGPGLRRDVAGELLLVEAGVAPGDVPVVHLVRDAEVAEAAEEVLLDALDEVAAVDEVLLAQGEEVAAVGALRGGGEAEEELRAEVVDEAPVGRGRGVVELVDDDVVEGVAREALEVGDAAEGLDRGEEDVGVRVPLLAHVEAQAGLGPDPAEGVPRLVEDLLAVRDEEDPAELGAVGVEGAEPGLAEAGGEDDEAGGVALLSRLFEGFERLLLDGVGRGDRGGLFRGVGGALGLVAL